MRYRSILFFATACVVAACASPDAAVTAPMFPSLSKATEPSAKVRIWRVELRVET